MNLRGTVVAVGDVREVSTRYGSRDLAELRVRPGSDGVHHEAGGEVRLTLWGDWAETAEQAEPGMEVAAHDVEENEFDDEVGYATTGDSRVVVEPGFLVDVTDVRGWVQCPRIYYLNKLSGVPLNYPVVKGTVVHEVFGDLLRGRDLDSAVAERVGEAGLDLGLLGKEAAEVEGEVRQHARAIEGWLAQGSFAGGSGRTDGGTGGDGGSGTNSGARTGDDGAGTDGGPGGDGGTGTGTGTSAGPDLDDSDSPGWAAPDEWRSEQLLVSPTYGIKGRADAVRRGDPVELKTGKNTGREPRFHDKIQAAAYALVLRDRGVETDTGTLLYTKNAALDRAEADGDLSPAKEFSIGSGLLDFVVRARNEIAAMEYRGEVPTGYEADAKCEYCFEREPCMVVAGRLDQESKAGEVGRPLPEAERSYFERLYRMVEAERRAVHREYAKLWEQSPEERADDDRAVIDLEPAGRERLEDGRWRLSARVDETPVSKLRTGDLALASDGDPVGGDAELARIERLTRDGTGDGGAEGDEPGVVVTADEAVELRRLDVYPSELSADRMLVALHDALLKGEQRRRDLLFGRVDPEFREVTGTFVENNDAQDEAVRRALAAEDFALVHGPPGTGKTHTIARIVAEFVERGERVLLSAFTNRAVDNALAAVRAAGVEGTVRVGTETGVREDMLDVRLETAGEPNDRAAALRDAPAVAATTATCGSRVLRDDEFDVAVVDEASQLTEPGTLAAINRADRFVLVGDHHQLPPVVQAEPAGVSEGPGPADLSESLFERLVERYPGASVLLDRQYRMAQRIQAFPSREFYDGRLRPATPEVAGRGVGDLAGVDPAALPPELRDRVAFVDPAGNQEGNANPREAERVAEVVESFLSAGVDPDDVGVIAPFRAQVGELSRRLPDGVVADTVDRFQGSSEEVVVVSFVATGDLDGPIFEDHRRVNVALTRARRALVLVGDEATLRSEPLYDRMVDWAEN